MKVVYLTTKTIQIKPYTICSSHQLQTRVEFHYCTHKKNFFSFRRYLQPPYTEPALFMKCPTRDWAACLNLDLGLNPVPCMVYGCLGKTVRKHMLI